ncbi:MAG: pseudouridine-5'-phosphate glycosidase [Terriglobales bacterium]
MKTFLRIGDQVAHALETGGAIVALESTVIAHGLPRPRNLETALAMEAAVREEGATPATIGIAAGHIVVGLSRAEIELLANSEKVAKVSRRDFAPVLASGGLGATTVAGTLAVAAEAGIRVMATGGIGGVHRGAEQTFDISADISELARSPVAVVCSGAKAILDLPRTLELLETAGVPVVGYRTSEFPAFYARTSGLALEHRVDDPGAAARIMKTQRELGFRQAVVFCNPPPEAVAVDERELRELVDDALQSAPASGISGKAVTPYLLDHLVRMSNGRTLETNIALLVENARVAARIALALRAT